jgi:hypothetical protein
MLVLLCDPANPCIGSCKVADKEMPTKGGIAGELSKDLLLYKGLLKFFRGDPDNLGPSKALLKVVVLAELSEDDLHCSWLLEILST